MIAVSVWTSPQAQRRPSRKDEAGANHHPFPRGVLSPLMSLLTGASCCRTAGVGSRTPTRGGTPSRPPSTTAGRRRWGRRAGPGRREAGSRDGSRRVGEGRTTRSPCHLALFCSGKLRACVRTYERTPAPFVSYVVTTEEWYVARGVPLFWRSADGARW